MINLIEDLIRISRTLIGIFQPNFDLKISTAP